MGLSLPGAREEPDAAPEYVNLSLCKNSIDNPIDMPELKFRSLLGDLYLGTPYLSAPYLSTSLFGQG
jgi:hypothetical protein